MQSMQEVKKQIQENYNEFIEMKDIYIYTARTILQKLQGMQQSCSVATSMLQVDMFMKIGLQKQEMKEEEKKEKDKIDKL